MKIEEFNKQFKKGSFIITMPFYTKDITHTTRLRFSYEGKRYKFANIKSRLRLKDAIKDKQEVVMLHCRLV